MAEKKDVAQGCFLRIDKLIDGFCIILLVTMILIVVLAVITRKGFGWMFAWSEEITLLCLTWFTFMGIAVGFRERLHLSMDLFDRLPKKIIRLSDRLIDLVTFFFGLYLVIFGWNFAMSMRGSILSATQMPNLVQYIVMPITGVMTCVYSALQLLGCDLRRYNIIEEEIKRDAE
ncbi:MAG: TRAP transporter small permease [Deltaproteobacteria bacterium]|nr:TRAP transporter small permease [Deltaproteobacteria bacterium]